MDLPPLLDRALLTELCREVATAQRVAPAAVEKDFFLTRLIWALAQAFGNELLLKGGTLLSKVDLGFHRMSEDVDMVMPLVGRANYSPSNAKSMNRVRDHLRTIVSVVGVTLPHPQGERFDKHTHAIWTLPYDSAFGPQAITLEVSLRPVLRPPRKTALLQLLTDPLVGDHSGAYCWALEAMEARAEKVRAACSRNAGRDFYDLDLLARRGADLSSAEFIELVDKKLAELNEPPLREHSRPFQLTDARRTEIDRSLLKDLPAVVRLGEEPLSLDSLLEAFRKLWSKN